MLLFKKVTVFFVIFVLFFNLSSYTYVSAQTVATTEAERAVLEAQLKDLEAEIAQKQKELESQKGQSVSLTREIGILKTQISTAQLNIKAKNLLISKLSGQIDEKENRIQTLEGKIDEQKDSLGQLVRKTNELDQSNMIHLLLSGKDVSDFYRDVDSFGSLKRSIQNSLDQIRGVKGETEVQKKDLEVKQDQEIDAKVELEKTRKQIESNEKQQNYLLSLSKKAEKDKQAYISTQQQKAAQIRARLFNFAGGTAAIPFGTAVQYAEIAAAKTGVRAAFILATLTQESSLGKNVGRCYLTVPETGAGIRTGTNTPQSRVMKPSRDVKPFLDITSALGFDYTKTLVSCPLATGYGGAMGPSQFIPSTWMLYKGRIEADLGVSYANPWNPQHAIEATALYFADLGAGAQTYTAERNAACKYYSGRSCGGSNAFYGNSVMKLSDSIQADMDYLKQYGVSRR